MKLLDWSLLLTRTFVIALLVCLVGKVTNLLLLVHLKRLNKVSSRRVGADAVNVDLVLFDVVNEEVSWIQSNYRALVAADLDSKNYCFELLVDEAN